VRITVELDAPAVRAPNVQVHILAELCETVVRANMHLGALPCLYASGVRYRPEVSGVETLALWDAVKARGFGDCGHIACWRVAYLRQHGEPKARVRIIGKQFPQGTVYHAIAQRQNGQLEDPSAILGMRVS
jgi:hypothetical protein